MESTDSDTTGQRAVCNLARKEIFEKFYENKIDFINQMKQNFPINQ